MSNMSIQENFSTNWKLGFDKSNLVNKIMLKTNTISDTRKAKVLLYSLKKRISIPPKIGIEIKLDKI